MSFKEKVNNYLEEQRKIEEAKEKAEMESKRQQKAKEEVLLEKKITEYQKEAQPLVEALNKTPVRQWLEEIKAEESQLQNAKIYLYPNGSCLPSNLYAKVKLAKSWEEEVSVLMSRDSDNWEDQTFRYEISIGVGARYDEQKIQFYSFSKDSKRDLRLEEKNICLNSDPERNQKIEKALIMELSRFRKENK